MRSGEDGVEAGCKQRKRQGEGSDYGREVTEG